MLQIDNLHATVGGTPILNGLTLAVNAGEVHALMGPNGAGKSTLAYVLGGRPGYEVTGGSVTFNGEDLLALEPLGRHHDRIGLADRRVGWRSRHGRLGQGQGRHEHHWAPSARSPGGPQAARCSDGSIAI